MATNNPRDYGRISEEAKAYFATLLESLKGKTALPWSKELNRPLLAELKGAGLVDYDGKGRKPPTFVKATGTMANVEVKATRASRKPSAKTSAMKDQWQHWEQYYIDTRPEAQREHERRTQSVSIETIAKRAKELQREKPLTNVQALEFATHELSLPFSKWLEEKYGKGMVKTLPPPPVGPDTRDSKS
jgi:hypothetical protein